jgi:uridine phosphorylase
MMIPPILMNKVYDAASVFSPENLLREARRQKSILQGNIPTICILDPDGDIAHYLVSSGQAHVHPHWACYHTKLYKFTYEGNEFGIIPYVVGASFAVLVAEELFVSGCKLLISMTSAGQITPMGQPPYFVLIERALRDEGTSYHYLPPALYCGIQPTLINCLEGVFGGTQPRVLRGTTWTTDAPFRETTEAIEFAHSEKILGVEMEAAALYAFAQVKSKDIVCFAHITNTMAQIEGDFEKGIDQGSHDALAVIGMTAKRWLANTTSPTTDNPIQGEYCI